MPPKKGLPDCHQTRDSALCVCCLYVSIICVRCYACLKTCMSCTRCGDYVDTSSRNVCKRCGAVWHSLLRILYSPVRRSSKGPVPVPGESLIKSPEGGVVRNKHCLLVLRASILYSSPMFTVHHSRLKLIVKALLLMSWLCCGWSRTLTCRSSRFMVGKHDIGNKSIK